MTLRYHLTPYEINPSMCVWKFVAGLRDSTDIHPTYSQLEYCKRECDGYENKCKKYIPMSHIDPNYELYHYLDLEVYQSIRQKPK